MGRHVALLLAIASVADALVDTLDLIWYDGPGAIEPEYYYRDGTRALPDGLLRTHKIIVNQAVSRLRRANYSTFANLDELRIDHCKVRAIEAGAFADLTRPLALLSLVGNNIASIDRGVLNDLRVVALNLSQNYISHVHEHAFDNMTSLETLILDFNQIACWQPLWLARAPALRDLSLRHNRLEELPESAFAHLARDDASLDFGYNRIHAIAARAFNCVARMRSLNLESNKLLALKVDAFRNVTSIERLNLRGNPLTCFPKELLQQILQKVTFPLI